MVLLNSGCSPTSRNDDWESARYHGLILLTVILTETPPPEFFEETCDCASGECVCSSDCECDHCRQKPTTSVASPPTKQVLYFTATWCPPCQRWREQELPALRAQDWNDDWLTVIDIDHRSDLRLQYHVHAVPTFVVLRNGQELARRTGYLNAIPFANWVNAL
ncbi:thioredoxin 2 [Polystyrenella longa]|uniref:Thioredoxin 2 n=2 Tax=Polystyrenella longa TaxID=2528007 RepID=A0A518CI94_9PLAN|nr:thioredoxin 2 [Polystyrenella longa]